MWHFLFPEGVVSGDADDLFADQRAALVAAGFSTSVVSDEVSTVAERLRGIPPGHTVVYRGWMATADEYAALVRAIERAGGVPLTGEREYLLAHHLPNWYPFVTEFTPETRVYAPDDDLAAEAQALGWGSYFVKDFVKSLKTGRGSVAGDPREVPAIVAELRESRGRIEGGVCVRRVEAFVPGSERRYFVLRGVAHAPTGGAAPAVVRACAARVPCPFFSVDVAERRDGATRVVEVGDGQMSDLVGWTADAFAAIWAGGCV